jgi:hypothetical protein
MQWECQREDLQLVSVNNATAVIRTVARARVSASIAIVREIEAQLHFDG